LWTVGKLIGLSIEREMPLRAGIAFGPCVIDPSRELYIGQPIVDAYDVEQAQEWVGAALHTSCEAAPAFLRLSNQDPAAPNHEMFVKYAVPSKPEYSLAWTIDWPFMSGAAPRSVLEKKTREIDEPRYQRKWSAALAYFNERRKWIPAG
jgi:hypothetical protein